MSDYENEPQFQADPETENEEKTREAILAQLHEIQNGAIAQDTLDYSGDPMIYFQNWEIHAFLYPNSITPYYGVKVIHNDGIQSSLVFEEGHTYYTGITGFDGLFKRMTVFKFKWTKGCEYYFHDTDSTNLFILNYPDIYQ